MEAHEMVLILHVAISKPTLDPEVKTAVHCCQGLVKHGVGHGRANTIVASFTKRNQIAVQVLRAATILAVFMAILSLVQPAFWLKGVWVRENCLVVVLKIGAHGNDRLHEDILTKLGNRRGEGR